MVNLVTVLVLEALGTVGHYSLPLSATDFGTQIGPWRLTEDATGFAALGSVARYDVIARGNRHNARSARFDDTSGFVTKDAREETLGVAAIEGVNVGVAKR